MLGLRLVLLVDVVQLSLLIPFDTLLNVLFFLLQAHLLAIVSDHVAHLVHFLLNAAATLGDLSLAHLLFLICNAHICLHLICICLLTCFDIGHTLSLLHHVVFNNFHCSLTFLYFNLSFCHSLLLKVSGQLGTSSLLLVLAPRELFDLLLLRLLHHLVTHLLLLGRLDQLLSLLLALNLQVFLGLLHHFLLKILPFLEIFRSELLPQLDLIVEHRSYLLHLLHLNLLLLLELLLVQLLAELLDLAPLVVANVRRHVLDLHLLAVLLLADLRVLIYTAQLGGCIGSSIRLLMRMMLIVLIDWLRIKSSLLSM